MCFFLFFFRGRSCPIGMLWKEVVIWMREPGAETCACVWSLSPLTCDLTRCRSIQEPGERSSPQSSVNSNIPAGFSETALRQNLTFWAPQAGRLPQRSLLGNKKFLCGLTFWKNEIHLHNIYYFGSYLPKTHRVSVSKLGRVIIRQKKRYVLWDSKEMHTLRVNKLCGENSDLLNRKASVVQSCHCALRNSFSNCGSRPTRGSCITLRDVAELCKT